MKELLRVAIDGPSGAGKSTIAKEVGKVLRLDYIDTGAMYRACGYKMLQEDVAAESGKALNDMLAETDIDFSKGNILLDGANINDKIRTPEISKMASKCSAIPEVRQKLVELQRKMGRTKSVIMDGRDIGTNVLTDAEYKFFLTASPEERASRRYNELIEKGQDVKYEDVLQDINDRDYNDINRKIDPLRKAEDAIELDTTQMSIKDVTDYILKEIKKDGSC